MPEPSSGSRGYHEALRGHGQALERWLVTISRRHGLAALRIAIGVVFVWFGALKLSGHSPVADLVANTLAWIPAWLSVPVVGSLEVLIGLGLIFALALRATMLAMLAQMGGTFMVFVLLPGEAFQQGNPLLFTATGEFVFKNVVLLAGLFALVGTLPEEEAAQPPRQLLSPPANYRDRVSRIGEPRQSTRSSMPALVETRMGG